MVDIEKVKRSRAQPISIPLDLAEGDAVYRTFSRPNGLFFVTEKSLVRVRSDDALDPNVEYADVPWERSVYLPHGSRDPLVARTILQTDSLVSVFVHDRERGMALKDISWSVMTSLASLRHIRVRITELIDESIDIIEADLPAFTTGISPRPLPFLPYLDIEFLSYVNEVRRILSKISEVFSALTDHKGEKGHFHKALLWLKENRPPNEIITQMLEADLRWIELWIKIRVAIEHPTPNQYVEALNFGLDPDRKVRLPTWRFVHPDYPDMARPQNMTDVLEILESNLLKFYEDLQVSLLPSVKFGPYEAQCALVEEGERDPVAPFRYIFGHAEIG